MATSRWSSVSRGSVDVAHPAGADQRSNLVVAKEAAGLESVPVRDHFRSSELKCWDLEKRFGVLVVSEKGLDLVVETWFSLARVAQPQFAPFFMLVERGTAEPVNQVPPVAGHVEHRSSSRRSHILARRQSRMTVSGETPKASAVS